MTKPVVTGVSLRRPSAPALASHLGVSFDRARVAAVVDDRFLSFAIDTAQVVGGEFWAPPRQGQGLLETAAVPHYDFSRARLRRLWIAVEQKEQVIVRIEASLRSVMLSSARPRMHATRIAEVRLPWSG